MSLQETPVCDPFLRALTTEAHRLRGGSPIPSTVQYSIYTRKIKTFFLLNTLKWDLNHLGLLVFSSHTKHFLFIFSKLKKSLGRCTMYIYVYIQYTIYNMFIVYVYVYVCVYVALYCSN